MVKIKIPNVGTLQRHILSDLIISEFFEKCCNSHTKTKHIHRFDLITVSQTKSNCWLPHHK